MPRYGPESKYGPDDYSEYGGFFYTGPIMFQASCDSTSYDPTEQDEVQAIFSDMLRKATGDGGRKRAAGEKPSWKVDEHVTHIFSHLGKWANGECADPDSGAHPLVHAAWRCLAVAYQETRSAPTRTEVDDWLETEQAKSLRDHFEHDPDLHSHDPGLD